MKTKGSTAATKGKLHQLTPEFIRSLRGSLKGEPSALKILLEERQRGHKV